MGTRSRPWRVYPAVPENGRWTFDLSGTGLRGRSFSSLERAMECARTLALPDEGGSRFIAVRVGPVGLWGEESPEGFPEIGDVCEVRFREGRPPGHWRTDGHLEIRYLNTVTGQVRDVEVVHLDS